MLSCRSVLFQPPEFIPAEAMGIEIPRRCCACKNWKECKFHMNSLSFKENTDYEVILSKPKLEEERKKGVPAYPFNTFGVKLIDNYSQARGCKTKMAARFMRTGRLEEFNRPFHNNVDRGVFKQLMAEHELTASLSITLAWLKHSSQAHMQPPR